MLMARNTFNAPFRTAPLHPTAPLILLANHIDLGGRFGEGRDGGSRVADGPNSARKSVSIPRR